MKLEVIKSNFKSLQRYINKSIDSNKNTALKLLMHIRNIIKLWKN